MKKVLLIPVIILLTSNILYSQISITTYRGKVQALLLSKNKKQWKNVNTTMQLYDKDKIRTGREASLELKSKSYIIFIQENSIIILDKVYGQGNIRTEMYIIKGQLRIKSISLAREENIIIRTKNSEITPKGTDFVIGYDGFKDTSVYVFDGKVKGRRSDRSPGACGIAAGRCGSGSHPAGDSFCRRSRM